jgi:Asp-tRNA(Asn)/Glu-tRNA(Gln) amidotransferase A subunit family amidase
VGYKPTAGWLSTNGLKCFSWSLDSVGLFARTLDDMTWFAQALTGRPLLADATAPTRPHVVGVPRSYPWEAPSAGASRAVETARQALQAVGIETRTVDLPPRAAAAFEAHAPVQGYEAAIALRHEFVAHREQLTPLLQAYLDEVQSIDAAAYARAQDVAAAARVELSTWLGGCDALLTPSAPDEAPEGLASTGSSSFNRLWSLLGWPCVSVPGLRGERGAPMGVQLIGPAGTDARVLAIAARLERALAGRVGAGDAGNAGRADPADEPERGSAR